MIKSSNYSPNLAGFKINHNGDVEFNDATFRGELKSATGTFAGMLIAASGQFTGELDCDSLQVRYDPTSMKRFPASGNYAYNTSVSIIINAVYSFLGLSLSTPTTVLVEDGYWYHPTYGGTVKALVFYQTKPGSSVLLKIQTNKVLYTIDGSSIESELWFKIGNGLKKIRLVNLPTSPAGEGGTVYKELRDDGNYNLLVKR